jgi:hypothetical protein
MGLPRTFVGFSRTDYSYYTQMIEWKKTEHIEFDFSDCQLTAALEPTNKSSIKRQCRERLSMVGTYVMLIGADTWHESYTTWEAEVALELSCRIIGVNIDNWRRVNPSTCPDVIRDIGAMFVPFSPHIVAYALAKFAHTQKWDDFHYLDPVYQRLGYVLQRDTAHYPPSPQPWQRWVR